MCGAASILVVIYGIVTTAEDESRSRLPRGVYGDNMIVQQSISDVSSDPNEGSHSWARWEKKKQKRTTTVTVKQCHCAGKITNSP